MRTFARAALFLAFALGSDGIVWAQPWSYNFGSAVGSWTTSGADSLTFIPAPEPGGGKARVRVGSGGGGFFLENQTISFGSESYLRALAPTGASVNKFSIYNFTTAQAFTLRFLVRLGTPDGSAGTQSGTWSLFVGDGERYSDNLLFVGSQVFTGLQWLFNDSGKITTRYRNAGSWSTAGLADTPFAQGKDYVVDIYGNNSPVELPYEYGGAQTVAANTYDLWINGVLAGDNLQKGQLPEGAGIDSWMFYGESSAENGATLFLDNISYQNGIAESPLSVELASFNAFADGVNAVTLTWRTISETENHGFEVQKSRDGRSFTRVEGGFVTGHNTTIEPHDYSFTDRSAAPGTWFYRLCQIDLSGPMHFTGPVRVDVATAVPEPRPMALFLEQNWPNPFNPRTNIGYSFGELGSGQQAVGNRVVKLAVYDLLGREVAVLVDEKKTPGTYQVQFDGAGLASGVYIYRLTAGAHTESRAMVLAR